MFSRLPDSHESEKITIHTINDNKLQQIRPESTNIIVTPSTAYNQFNDYNVHKQISQTVGNIILENSQIKNNYVLKDDNWWSKAISEDKFNSPLAFDASENGLWNGRFVPPPPRPPFLEEAVQSDGLTTCDLCTWALDSDSYSLDESLEAAGELGWAFTLIIVSIISALIGAIIMVIVLKCRRSKTDGGSTSWWFRRNNRNTNCRTSISFKRPVDNIRRPTSNSGVWTWLSNHRTSTRGDPIEQPAQSSAQNHYTNMDDSYTPIGVGEALYAELDTESVRSENPVHQNAAYSQYREKFQFQQDMPMVSSAPSSAYYSDLSVTAVQGGHDRPYEVVTLTQLSGPHLHHHHWNDDGGGGESTGSGIQNNSTGNTGGLLSTRRTARLAVLVMFIFI